VLRDVRGPAFRPGDQISVEYLHYKDGYLQTKIAQVRVSVQQIKSNSAASNYAPSKEQELFWDFEKPANADLKLRVRSSMISPHGFSRTNKGSTSHDFTFEFENVGNSKIKQLKYAVEYFDATNQSLGQVERYAASRSTSPIKRGETRVTESIYILDSVPREKISYYKVKVVDLR
jgi:hypothetical protein